MNQIEKQIDKIIAGLKLNKALNGVRFVREYSNRTAENPISGFLAVVSVTDTAKSKSYIGDYLTSQIKGEQYTAKAQIRVYAPADENGTGLSEIVSEILTGLKSADSEKIIMQASASSIAFDPDMNAIYRVIDFTVEFYLCEEA